MTKRTSRRDARYYPSHAAKGERLTRDAKNSAGGRNRPPAQSFELGGKEQQNQKKGGTNKKERKKIRGRTLS